MGGTSGRKLKPTKIRYCKACGAKKSCDWQDQRHVYVIELQREVLQDKAFRRLYDTDTSNEGTRIFYVGQTQHQVECRYKQHRRKQAGRKAGRPLLCSCESGAPQEIPPSPYNRGNIFVRKYALKSGALRPEFFLHHNPISIKGNKEAAKEMERKIAEKLRSLGHLAHFR